MSFLSAFVIHKNVHNNRLIENTLYDLSDFFFLNQSKSVFKYLFTSVLKSSHFIHVKHMVQKGLIQKYVYIQRWPSVALSKYRVLTHLPTPPHSTSPGMVPKYLIQEQPDSAELYQGRAELWDWLVQHTAVAGWLCCSNTFLSKKTPCVSSPFVPPPPPPSLCCVYSLPLLASKCFI